MDQPLKCPVTEQAPNEWGRPVARRLKANRMERSDDMKVAGRQSDIAQIRATEKSGLRQPAREVQTARSVPSDQERVRLPRGDQQPRDAALSSTEGVEQPGRRTATRGSLDIQKDAEQRLIAKRC